MPRTIVLDSVSYTLPNHGDTNYDEGAAQLNAYFDALTTANNSRKAEILLKLDKAGAVSAPANGSTTTLTSASNRIQLLTPAGACNLVLPTGGIVAGDPFYIYNFSANDITIKASGGATKKVLNTGSYLIAAGIATPTLPADWSVMADDYLDNTQKIITINSTLNELPTDYAAATSTAQTLTVSSYNKTYTPTADHDVNLPTTSVGAGWTRKIFNRSTAYVLTVKATTSTPGDGGTVCKIIPNTWVIFQSRQATPTTNAHWMQVDAGGDWAGWGGSASNFNATGYGAVTAIAIWARREKGNLVMRGKFQCGTVGASTGDILLPWGLSLNETIIGTGEETWMGTYNMVFNAASSPIWAVDNNAGIFYYRPAAGTTYIQTTSRFVGGLYENRYVNAYIATGANVTFSELTIPIATWSLG